MKSDLNAPFNLINVKNGDLPLPIAKFNADVPSGTRVNHWMLKNNDDASLQGFIPVDEFVRTCVNYLNLSNRAHFWQKRYAYLTVDTKAVEIGQAQRTAGWHLDGMQGDEICTKVAPDIAFVWCTDLPTRFLRGGLDLGDLDPSRDNIFDAIEHRIDLGKTYTINPYEIYMIHAYMPHTGEIATKAISKRIFIRLSFSLTPITSKKMTVNPGLLYNYPIHTTSGDIPENLRKYISL